MRRSWPFMPIAVCWCGFIVCAGAESSEPSDTLTREVQRLFVQLDSNEFIVRTRAFERLQELSREESSSRLLADLVERAMIDAGISFEVRKQLERLRRDLPPAQLPPAQNIDPETIDRLLTQLAGDSYARRLGAESRLRWLLGSAGSVELIYERVKQRAAGARLAREQTPSLKRIYELARAAWLEDESRKSDSPAPVEKIAGLVSQLAAPASADRFRLTDEPAAVVELRDLLACGANIVPVRDALEERLAAGGLSPEAERYTTELIDLTKPAMVAEYWERGHHHNIQRLLVGVPSVTEGVGTSHFDRIDDETAHCVSGVNLSEGDYPVGVAVPHPRSRDRSAFFHLVNLPTPRRRMAYEYRVQEDEAARYAAVVARTLDRFLVNRLPINERELMMIVQFDPHDVSRFAGRYLATVEDRAFESDTPLDAVLQAETLVPRDGPTIHGLLCSWLALKGTRDAVPELLTAIEKNCMLAPTETRPYRYDRFAALTLAQRDPWPDVEQWLARMLTREEQLIHGQAAGPDLGATAASILLRRHGGRLEDFGLIASGDAFARRYGLETYRYETPDSAQRVAKWWRKQQQAVTTGSNLENGQ